jgi:hypothetical protein
MFVGAALWGGCNWGHGDVDINVNRYNNFNRTNISNGRWDHNVDHRRGVQYRDSATQQRFNKGNTRAGAENREAYRGRADQARGELNGGNQQQIRDQVNQTDRQQARDRANTSDRANNANRATTSDRQPQRDTRPSNTASTRERSNTMDRQPSAQRDNAFRDIDRGGSARAASSRGNSSFHKPSMSRGGRGR